MSQTNYGNNKTNNMHTPYTMQSLAKRQRRKYRYNRPYDTFNFYNKKYNYQPWNYSNRRFPPQRHSQSSKREVITRSPSPFSGTEEYNLKKIQETSEMIKKRLLMPPEADDALKETQTQVVCVGDECARTESDKGAKNQCEKNVTKTSKKASQYNVEEIHNRIIAHISNMSHGKKVNLISATSSGYDIAIQQIQKQKRLELSKALRDICSKHTVEGSDVINAIIPDIGIKIEDLPLEVIQALSSTLDLNFDNSSYLQNCDETVNVETEVFVKDNFDYIAQSTKHKTEDVKIKQEIFSDETEIKHSCIDPSFNNNETNESMEDLDSVFLETNIANVQIKSENNLDQVKKENTTEFNVNLDLCSQIVTEDSLSLNEFISTGSQTEPIRLESCACQTDIDLNKKSHFKVRENIDNLNDAITAMLEIDKEIARLTKLRQSIFYKLQDKGSNSTLSNGGSMNNVKATKTKRNLINKISTEKNNIKKSITKRSLKSKNNTEKVNEDKNTCIKNKKTTREVINLGKGDVFYEKPLEFEISSEKILALKLVEETLLAASETGRIFYINTSNGRTEATIEVSQTPITSLCYLKTYKKQPHFFVGSFEPFLHEYHYRTKALLKVISTEECVQCLEHAWEYIFIGTTNGSLMRYSLKRNIIDFRDRISNCSVLVMKATQEGARRVLLVGSRNAPVCVRDAMSGLHLRTLGECQTPTVYSLLLENSMVYCGTTFHDILVFSFHDGNLIYKHQATNTKGICCMKVVRNLLFASCYNGNIYVYNIKNHKYVGMIEGAGGVILSMEVWKNLVIVGTMSLNFKSILIPDYILENNVT